MYCQDCGTELDPEAQYCHSCGTAIESPADTVQQRSENSRQNQSSPQAINSKSEQKLQNSSGSISRRTLIGAGGGVAVLGAGWFVHSKGTNLGSPPLDQVVIEFLDVRRPDIGATSATLPLLLTFRNPTDTAIPNISGDLDMLVSNQRVASDELAVNRLEPNEETVVNADVIVQYADSSTTIVNTIQSGEFRVKLELIINSGGATRELRVAGEV